MKRWTLAILIPTVFSLFAAVLSTQWPFSFGSTLSSSRADLIESLQGLRLTEGRLSGFPHARLNGNLSKGNRNKLVSLLRKKDRDMRPGVDPAYLGELALLDLVEGKTKQSIARLKEAVVISESPASLYNDLAVVELTRAQSEDLPEHFVTALLSAQKALELDRTSLEANFNYALLLGKLSLKADAIKAWDVYLQLDLDPESEWAEEANRHREVLMQPSGNTVWKEQKAVLLSAISRKDIEAAELIVERFPQPIRQYTEDVLFSDWAQAREHGRVIQARNLLDVAEELGNLLYNTNRDLMIKDAVAAINQSNLVSPERSLLLAQGHRLYSEGVKSYELEHIKEAQRLFEASRVRFENGNSPFVKWAIFQLARCAYQHNDYRKALDLLNSLITDPVSRRYPILTARALWVTGLIRYILGDLSMSLQAYSDSLSLFQRAGEFENVAVVHCFLAENFRRIGDLTKSWWHLHAALRLLGEVQDHRRRHMILKEAARASFNDGVPEIALLFHDELLRGLTPLKDPLAMAQALQRRAEVRAAVEQRVTPFEDLAEARRQAALIADSKIRRAVEGDVLLTTGRLWRPNNPRQAIAALSQALSAHEETQYFQRLPLIHLELALAHNALQEEELAKNELKIAIEEIEAQRVRLSDSTLRAKFFDQAKDVFEEMILLEVKRGDIASALNYAERSRARVLLDLVDSMNGPDTGGQTSDVLTAMEICASLPENVTLVVYSLFEDRLLTWILQKGNLDFTSVPLGEREISDIVLKLRRSVAERDGLVFRQSSTKLYEILIRSSLGENILTQHLVFVPDGVLFNLPFAALMNPKTSKYLVQSHAISIVPSGNLYVSSINHNHSRRERDLFKSALFIGNPTLAHEWLQPLPGVETEARMVAAAIPGAKCLVGESATKGEFFHLAPKSTLIHFSGHALVDREDPLLSGLVLASNERKADSGILSAKELYQLGLGSTRLVLLSACNTAEGARWGNEGVINLARPFLAAGVSSVIVSLWRVDDRTTPKLLGKFYEQLRTSSDPAGALQAAQRSFIEGGEVALQSPDRWAVFTHIGGMDF